MKSTAVLFGHRTILEDIEKPLFNAIENLIKIGVAYFMVGNQGDFDKLSTKAVRILKKKYPYIKLLLVLPYFTNKLNQDRSFYETIYDDIIIPDVLAGLHYKKSIIERNKWMIDNSNYLIAYSRKDYGGAYTALQYAKKNNKFIILL